MSTEMTSYAGTLPASKLNASASVPLIDPEAVMAEWRSAATAGASQPVRDPVEGWNSYITNGGWLSAGTVSYDDKDLVISSAVRGLDLTSTSNLGEILAHDSAGLTYLTNLGRSLWGYVGEHTPPNGLGWKIRPEELEPFRFNYTIAEETPSARYRAAVSETTQAQDDGVQEFRQQLDATRSIHTRRSPKDLVIELTEDRGLGQFGVAKALGVSPTAVRKWRRGESASSNHRESLARLSALCVLLDELDLHAPSSWLEIAISEDSDLTPLDLFAAGRSELVAMVAAGMYTPSEALTAFDHNWRVTTAPDGDYVIVKHADGSRSAVPRQAI